MSPNSIDSPLEKPLARPLGIKTLVYKDTCTYICSGPACGRERIIQMPIDRKMAEGLQPMCPVECWEAIKTTGLGVYLLLEERGCAWFDIK